MSSVNTNLRLLLWLASTFVAFPSSLLTASENDPEEFVVVGYLPEYRVRHVRAERFAALTDLIYFGIQPTASGQIDPTSVGEETLEKLRGYRRTSGCRLLLCVGGGGRSAGFPRMATDPASRENFIHDLHKYCRRHAFDGVDYDWEHPKGEEQMGAYVKLLAETKRTFQDDNLLVTIAQAGWQDIGLAGYAAVDRVHLMSYDHDFPHATLDKSRADVSRLLEWGCPARKIVLGLPFYGRNKARQARTYADLTNVRRILNPATDEIDGFAFNGRATVTAKVNFVFQSQLGGIMIWELGQDTNDPSTSLLAAIAEQVKGSYRK